MDTKYSPKSFEELKADANNYLSVAQYHLGLLYLTGETDIFCEACDLNNDLNNSSFADIKQSLEDGVYWLEKAAEQNNIPAITYLGTSYCTGNSGIEIDLEKSAYWFLKASNLGDAFSKLRMGINYEFGFGVEVDFSLAVSWYKKAAEMGVPEAQYRLGKCYEFGRGVEQDKELAVYWYTKATNDDAKVAKEVIESHDNFSR